MKMTRDIERQYMRECARAGIDDELADKLRRIAITLHRWSEAECNGEIEIDDDNKAYRCWDSIKTRRRYLIPNLEAGAIKRLKKLLPSGATFEYQGDPRGWPLTIYIPWEVSFREVSPPPYSR